VNTTAGLAANDLLLMCDYRGGTIFKATGITGVVNGTIQHTTGGTPANAAANLPKTQPTDATNPPIWSTNATVSRLRATRWYVGCNGRVGCALPGGRSLYQSGLQNVAGTLQVVTNEIATGVDNLTITYLPVLGTGYVGASLLTTPAQWNDVAAVKVTLGLASPDRAGVDGTSITRNVQHVISLRNHLP
jgi:type IV pilus assembly protein PilW